MKLPVRKAINGLKPYEPGKPIKELQRDLGIPQRNIIKLASNENPIGPSPKAVKAIQDEVYGINRYPEGSCFYLKEKLAAMLKLKPENLIFGNGSDELIDIIAKTFLEESQEAIICEPAFLEYMIIVKTRGAKLKKVALDKPEGCGFNYNIDKILKSINSKTKLIFLGNPDNPTGAYLKIKELKVFLKKMPKDVIVVFDEAYRELVDVRDYSNPFEYIKRGNIIVLRTFSKAYGLAGLRIGYAIADKKLISWMERTRQPFNVNLLAQAAALAALDDKTHLAKTKKLISQGKKFLVASLKTLGFEVIESPANFILFAYEREEGDKIFKKLLTYGVIIRSMKAYKLDKWARVNVGTMAENKRFINTLKEVMSSGGKP